MTVFTKNRFSLIALMLVCGFVSGQSITPDVIASDGGFQTSASGSVSYSVGEPVIETFSDNINFLTQGFEQPEPLLPVNIPETSAEGAVYVYPNPVADFITINFKGMLPGNYTLMMYDVFGKLIKQSVIKIYADILQDKIPMTEYSNGIYLFKLIENTGVSSKEFKIIKNK